MPQRGKAGPKEGQAGREEEYPGASGALDERALPPNLMDHLLKLGGKPVYVSQKSAAFYCFIERLSFFSMLATLL